MPTRILMVCLGNICRSTMAEYVLRDLVRKAGLDGQVVVDSAGTAAETGYLVHHGTRDQLAKHVIPCGKHRARQLVREDYARYNLIIGMDNGNMRAMQRIFSSDPEHKLHLLLDWTESPRQIADPWYTDDFDTAYADIAEGCEGLMRWLTRNENAAEPY